MAHADIQEHRSLMVKAYRVAKRIPTSVGEQAAVRAAVTQGGVESFVMGWKEGYAFAMSQAAAEVKKRGGRQ